MIYEFSPGSYIYEDYITRFENAATELDQDLAAATQEETEEETNSNQLYNLNAILDAFED